MDYFSQHFFSDPKKKTLDYSLWFIEILKKAWYRTPPPLPSLTHRLGVLPLITNRSTPSEKECLLWLLLPRPLSSSSCCAPTVESSERFVYTSEEDRVLMLPELRDLFERLSALPGIVVYFTCAHMSLSTALLRIGTGVSCTGWSGLISV